MVSYRLVRELVQASWDGDAGRGTQTGNVIDLRPPPLACRDTRANRNFIVLPYPYLLQIKFDVAETFGFARPTTTELYVSVMLPCHEANLQY